VLAGCAGEINTGGSTKEAPDRAPAAPDSSETTAASEVQSIEHVQKTFSNEERSRKGAQERCEQDTKKLSDYESCLEERNASESDTDAMYRRVGEQLRPLAGEVGPKCRRGLRQLIKQFESSEEVRLEADLDLPSTLDICRQESGE